MLRVRFPSLTPTICDLRLKSFLIINHKSIRACSFNWQNVGLQNRSSQFKSECACQFNFGFWIGEFGFTDFNLKSKLTNPKSNWGRSSMELEQFITNEQVGGSSPLALSKNFRLRSSMESERRASKSDVAGSSPAGAIRL